MNDADRVEAMIMRVIVDSVPEVAVALEQLDAHVDLWQELGLDSMEHLAIVEGLSIAAGRDIPERDYPRLLSLAGLRDYLAS